MRPHPFPHRELYWVLGFLNNDSVTITDHMHLAKQLCKLVLQGIGEKKIEICMPM